MPESWTQHLKHVLGEETGGQVELFQEITTRSKKRNIGLSYQFEAPCYSLYAARMYLLGAHDRTELRMKHLSAVMRMLLRRMLLIEARTSAVSLGFWNSYSRTSRSISSSGGCGLLSSAGEFQEEKRRG